MFSRATGLQFFKKLFSVPSFLSACYYTLLLDIVTFLPFQNHNLFNTKETRLSPIFKNLIFQVSDIVTNRAMMVPLSLFLKNDSNTVVAKQWSHGVVNYACAGECTLHRCFCCIALAYPHDVVTNHAKRYICCMFCHPFDSNTMSFLFPRDMCVCVCVCAHVVLYCVVLLSLCQSVLTEILMRLKVNKDWLRLWQVFILLFYWSK